ncbi:hypothetical protein ACOMHN_055592 [Nucella lapillus]
MRNTLALDRDVLCDVWERSDLAIICDIVFGCMNLVFIHEKEGKEKGRKEETKTKLPTLDTDSAHPGHEKLFPAADSAHPGHEKLFPAADSAHPGHEKLFPAADSAHPGHEKLFPAADSAHPGHEKLFPAADWASLSRSVQSSASRPGGSATATAVPRVYLNEDLTKQRSDIAWMG